MGISVAAVFTMTNHCPGQLKVRSVALIGYDLLLQRPKPIMAYTSQNLMGITLIGFYGACLNYWSLFRVRWLDAGGQWGLFSYSNLYSVVTLTRQPLIIVLGQLVSVEPVVVDLLW